MICLTPSVGFPVTICVVCYGPHAALAHRFLHSLYQYTDPALFMLRAGLNEVEPATRRLFDDFSARFGNIEQYVEARNRFKNPLMRRVFHERPLTSRCTLWCDDDTHFALPDWLERLTAEMQRQPEVAMWGQLYALASANAPLLRWVRQASWYRGVPFQAAKDTEPSGTAEFHFATGGFWALRTDVLRLLNWPDPRLIQANEDFLLGEAMRQNGFELGCFDHGVRINDAPRRNADADEVNHLVLDSGFPSAGNSVRLCTADGG